MEKIPISLQPMDLNCKPVDARAIATKQGPCTIGGNRFLEEDYSSEWDFSIPSFSIHKKN
jgi:hypothetical protein